MSRTDADGTKPTRATTQPRLSRGPFSFELLMVPREIDRPDATEDAGAHDEGLGVCVVADGASTSYDPRGWSRHLVRSALEVAGAPPDVASAEAGNGLDLVLPAAIERARKTYTPRLTRAPTPGIRAKPSAATVGALRMARSSDGWWWMAEVVGDVNVILHTPGCSPMLLENRQSINYGSFPDVVVSSPTSRPPRVRYTRPCRALPGDSIFMFTDGIGEWLAARASDRILESLRTIGKEDFDSFVASERQAGRMPLDDVTLARCKVHGADSS